MWDLLNQIQQEGCLVDLRRETVDRRAVRGFVTAVAADLFVFSTVDDQCEFNGTSALRTEDVTFVRRNDEVLQAWTRVLQESPSSPAPVKHLDLSSWESLVRSAAGEEPVVTFHRERVDESICHIGTNIKIDGEWVIADEVSVEGTVDGQFALKMSDLTKVDFGGGYERALWRMIQSSKRPSK